jgi:hypothetical protein
MIEPHRVFCIQQPVPILETFHCQQDGVVLATGAEGGDKPPYFSQPSIRRRRIIGMGFNALGCPCQSWQGGNGLQMRQSVFALLDEQMLLEIPTAHTDFHAGIGIDNTTPKGPYHPVANRGGKFFTRHQRVLPRKFRRGPHHSHRRASVNIVIELK